METEDLELIRTRAAVKALRTQVLGLTSGLWKDLTGAGLRDEMEGDWLPHVNRIAEAIEEMDLWLVQVENQRVARRERDDEAIPGEPIETLD